MALLRAIADLIDTEPALVAGLVTAVLALLVAFGVHLSEDQQRAVQGIAAAVLAVVAALYVRAKSVPVVKLPNPLPASPPVPPVQ